MEGAIFRAPIAIMAFNRPDYLRRVLESLISQVGSDIASREIYLFQDGPVNPFSGAVRTTIDIVKKNEQVFREYFPAGVIKTSWINLGIALNFDRAERFLFEV